MARIWLLLVLTPVSCLLQTDEGRLRAPFLTETFCVEVAGGAPGAVRRTPAPVCPVPPPRGVWVQEWHLGTWSSAPLGHRGGLAWPTPELRLSPPPGREKGVETMVRGELCPRHVHTLQSQPPDA